MMKEVQTSSDLRLLNILCGQQYSLGKYFPFTSTLPIKGLEQTQPGVAEGNDPALKFLSRMAHHAVHSTLSLHAWVLCLEISFPRVNVQSTKLRQLHLLLPLCSIWFTYRASQVTCLRMLTSSSVLHSASIQDNCLFPCAWSHSAAAPWGRGISWFCSRFSHPEVTGECLLTLDSFWWQRDFSD